MTSVNGTQVDVPTPDGTADAYLAHPADGVPRRAILYYGDAFGLRPGVREMVDRLAAAGYTVLAPNTLYRHGRAPVVELPAFIDAEARGGVMKRIRPMIRELGPDSTARDSRAYLDWLAASPLVADGPVGITGYCMGAGLALRTAIEHPDRVAAAAGFHGAFLAAETPDSPHLEVGKARAELYFAHADQDPAMPADQVERLENALTEAGVRHHTEVYPGAQHGYTQADTDAYDRESAERHWTALLDLFERNL